MSEKLAQLEHRLANAQKVEGNWYQCMIIQMAILQEKNATSTARLHTYTNK